MRIAICDDEKVIVKYLHEKIEVILCEWNINSMIFDFYDANDMIYEIETTGIFDIIYMDIEIGSENGINIADILNQRQYIYTLIFISQYDTYYRKAFEVQPFWFLDKPFDDDKIRLSLKKALDNIKYKYETIDFYFAKEFYRVLIDKIIYVQSSGRTINIICIDDKVYKYYDKLSSLEATLKSKKKKFIRINRSVCVNTDYVTKFTSENVQMINGEIINIGITYKAKVRDEIVNIFGRKVNWK